MIDQPRRPRPVAPPAAQSPVAPAPAPPPVVAAPSRPQRSRLPWQSRRPWRALRLHGHRRYRPASFSTAARSLQPAGDRRDDRAGGVGLGRTVAGRRPARAAGRAVTMASAAPIWGWRTRSPPTRSSSTSTAWTRIIATSSRGLRSWGRGRATAITSPRRARDWCPEPHSTLMQLIARGRSTPEVTALVEEAFQSFDLLQPAGEEALLGRIAGEVEGPAVSAGSLAGAA